MQKDKRHVFLLLLLTYFQTNMDVFASSVTEDARPSWFSELPREVAEPQRRLNDTLLHDIDAKPELLIPLFNDLRSAFCKADVPYKLREEIQNSFIALINPNLSCPFLPCDFMEDFNFAQIIWPPYESCNTTNDLVDFIRQLSRSYPAFEKLKAKIVFLDELSKKPFVINNGLDKKVNSIRNAYIEFVKDVSRCAPEKREELMVVPIEGEFLNTHYVVKKRVAKQILAITDLGVDLPPQFDSSPCNRVTHVGNTYFKRHVPQQMDNIVEPCNPMDPPMQWAMSAFHRMLFDNDGLISSCLLVFPRVVIGKDAPDQDALLQERNSPNTGESYYGEIEEKLLFKKTRSYEVQVTPEVEGENLTDYLNSIRDTPQLISDLNMEVAHSLIMSSMFLNLADFKGNNSKVTRDGKIIGFDNDWGLASMVVLAHIGSTSEPALHFIEARNLLFAIAGLMNMTLNDKVRHRFLSKSLNIPCFILQWLNVLEYHNRLYTSVATQVQLKLRNGTVPHILAKMRKAGDFVQRNPHATLQQVFEDIDPLGGKYYKFRLHHVPWQFDTVLYKPNHRRRENSLESVLDGKQMNLQALLNEKSTPAGAFMQRDQDLALVRGDILQKASPKELQDPELQAEVQKYFPAAITRFRLSEGLSHNPFSTTISLRFLESLNVRDQDLSFSDLKVVCGLPALRELNFQGNRPIPKADLPEFVVLLQSRTLRFDMIMMNPISEEVHLNPFNFNLLQTVKFEDTDKRRKSAFRNIKCKTFKLDAEQIIDSQASLSIVCNLINFFEQEGISFDVEREEERYCVGYLYYGKTFRMRITNFFRGAHNIPTISKPDPQKAIIWFKKALPSPAAVSALNYASAPSCVVQ